MKAVLPDLFDRHPRPWRVTEEYRQWWICSNYAANPPAIVDAAYDLDGDTDHIVISSSEWLHLDIEDADAIVAIVNREGSP